jgi:hypothetical protein
MMEDTELTITLTDGALFLQPDGQDALPMSPESETDFFIRGVNAQMTFTKDELGSVTGLVLHQGGRDVRAEKIR